MSALTARDRLHNIIHELSALEIEYRKLAKKPDAEIVARFHREVVLTLKSLEARAENATYYIRDGLNMGGM